MKQRKLLRILLAILACLISLTACQNNPSANPSDFPAPQPEDRLREEIPAQSALLIELEIPLP